MLFQNPTVIHQTHRGRPNPHSIALALIEALVGADVAMKFGGSDCYAVVRTHNLQLLQYAHCMQSMPSGNLGSAVSGWAVALLQQAMALAFTSLVTAPVA